MQLFYIVKLNKKNEVRPIDASTFIEREKKLRALNNKRPLMGKERYIIEPDSFSKKRMLFRDID